MPYVKQEMRDKLEVNLAGLRDVLSILSDDEIEGALNYTFTELIASLARDGHGGFKYRHVNRAIGALECCKLELYRRVAAEYENWCITQNGDVKVYEDYKEHGYVKL